jgi:hypothetical protein
MERTVTEIKLLTIRQRIKDTLDYLRKPGTVAPIQEYRRVLIQYQLVHELLLEYRRGPSWGKVQKRN